MAGLGIFLATPTPILPNLRKTLTLKSRSHLLIPSCSAAPPPPSSSPPPPLTSVAASLSEAAAASLSSAAAALSAAAASESESESDSSQSESESESEPESVPVDGGLRSKKVMETEARVFVQTYKRAPLVIERGKGCWVYDFEGKGYLDMGSGIAVNALGHGDPDWMKALVEQAGKLAHVSNMYYTEPQVELGECLQECSFADRVFLVNSGTEANEAAIKFARKFQRHTHGDEKEPATEFISFTNSFHGRTMGALALTSKQYYRTPFEPVMPGVTFVEYGNIEEAKKAIQPGKTAAVFVEPIQGEGGIYSATKEFLQSLRDTCDASGALLVFDEIQCGLGRTGHLWAHEAYGVTPDIMTLAKPLAGGLPIGAVLMTEGVAAAINYGDHGSTFAGGPLISHVALTVLNKIKAPTFLASVSSKGEYLQKLLNKKLGSNPRVKEVRGIGLIVGIELDVPAAPLVDACRDSGLLILTAGNGNVVRLVPPLIISKEELKEAVHILQECLDVLDGNKHV